jgi:hypothetical protein
MRYRYLGAYQTPSGLWRIEAYAGRGQQWYRILHDGEVYLRDGHPCEREPLGTVEAVLRDNGVDMAELAPEVSGG